MPSMNDKIGGADQLDLGAIIQQPMKDPDWLKICVLIGLMCLVPIAGFLNLSGWMKTIADSLPHARPSNPHVREGLVTMTYRTSTMIFAAALAVAPAALASTAPASARAELSDLAWLFNMNRGIFMTPGREEEWTLSVTHTFDHVDRYVAVFEELAQALTA